MISVPIARGVHVVLGVEQVERVAGLVHQGAQERRRHLVQWSVPGRGDRRVAAEVRVGKSGSTLPWHGVLVEHDPEQGALSGADQQPQPPGLAGRRPAVPGEQGLQFGVGQGRVLGTLISSGGTVTSQPAEA